MERTEIKIPGKNTRDQSKAGRAASKALKQPRGRRPGIANATLRAPEAALVARSSKKRTMKNIKSKRKMSRLEKLPTELLEKVFLYCFNLDLPRASPVIGGKLSSDHIYMRTMIKAFDLSWNYFYRRNLICFIYEPWMGELESSVLRCRWANISTLLRGVEYWDKQPGQYQPWIRTNFYFYQTDPEGLVLEEKTASECFEEDFLIFTNNISNIDAAFARKGLIQKPDPTYEIPQTLLRGPWSEESVRRLFWIANTGGRLDWLTSTSGEVAQLGLQSAIAIGDLRIIQSLQWVGLHEKLDVQCLIWAMQNAGGGRLMVLKALLEMHLLCQKGLKRIQSFKDKDKFQLALYKEKDDAERTSDIATLQLLEGIEESLTFKLWDVDLRSYPNFCGYYLINPEHEVLQEI